MIGQWTKQTCFKETFPGVPTLYWAISIRAKTSFVNTQPDEIHNYGVFRPKMRVRYSCSFSALIKVKSLISGGNLEDGSKTLKRCNINNKSPFHEVTCDEISFRK